MSVADGFPVEVDDYAFSAFAVMLLITPPTSTELCSDSAQSVFAKRSVQEYVRRHLKRAKRQDSGSGIHLKKKK